MSKLKQPLYSLGAKGSLADTITLQENRGVDIARSKPKPTGAITLPKQYQRWLYRDYADLWHVASKAVKALFREQGVRYHLTGYQYWMKYNLTNLPDIIGWWKLDDTTDMIAYDSSREENHGVIIGAIPTPGLIAGGRLFDGLNDKITIPTISRYTHHTEKSVLVWFRATAFTGTHRNIYYHSWANGSGGDVIYLFSAANDVIISLNSAGGVYATRQFSFVPGQDYCVGYTWNGHVVRYYRNASQPAGTRNFDKLLHCEDTDMEIGTRQNLMWYNSMVDNLIIFDRCLSPAEVFKWTNRRWPIQ